MVDADAPQEGMALEDPAPSLGRGSAITFASALVGVAIGFVSNIVLARVLGPAGKGSVDVALSTSWLVALVVSLSLAASISYHIAAGTLSPAGAARTLWQVFLLQAAISVAVVIILGQAAVGGIFIPLDISAFGTAAVAIVVVVTIAYGYVRAISIGLSDFVRVALADLLFRGFGLVAIAGVAAVTVGGFLLAGTDQFLGAVALGQACGLFALAIVVVRASRGRGSQSLALPPLLWYALPIGGMSVIAFLNYRLDVFFVGKLSGLSQVGIYTVAVSLAQLIWLLPQAAATVLLPHVSRQRSRAAGDTAADTARVTRIVVLASVGASVAVGVGSVLLLPTVFGNAFKPSIVLLIALLPGCVMLSIATVPAAYIAGIGRPGINLRIATVTLAVTVVMDVALIPRFGAMGAAVASTTAYSISAILTIAYFLRWTDLASRSVLVATAADVRAVVQLAQSLRSRPPG
jgi:O-antigen/teichoic acid export membrane protein